MGLLSENAAKNKSSIFNGTFKWKYVKKNKHFQWEFYVKYVTDESINEEWSQPLSGRGKLYEY